MTLMHKGPWLVCLGVLALPAAAQPASAPAPANAASAGGAACTAALTQADMTRCAHEDFLAASAVYAERHAALATKLPRAQRERLRRMQQAWIGYRTAACTFESGAAQGGSLQAQLNWRCAARLTRERADELQRMTTCREGDVTCNRSGR